MSKVFLLSYDLPADDENYSELIEELKRLKAKRVLDSVWSIKLPDTNNSTKIINHFKKIAENISLIVVEVVRDQKYYNIKTKNEEPYPSSI